MTKIAFITDLHIPLEGLAPLGLNPLSQFKEALAHAVAGRPDIIIIGGDLSNREPIPYANRVTHELLSETEIPFLIIAGNHDRPEQLSEEFSLTLKNGELYYLHELPEEEIMILDSSSKRISKHQLDWMSRMLKKKDTINKIFIHHPLSITGIPFMDKNHALENREEVMTCLSQVDRKLYVFSGHCHASRVIHGHHFTQYITPSTYLQISEQAEDFLIDHTQPGYRFIEIGETGTIITHLHYPGLEDQSDAVG